MTARPRKSSKTAPPKRLARGFVKTSGLLHRRIRKAGEKRGFSETRLLTNWAEIVGLATAKISRPVNVSYGRQGLGATLTLLTNGANAPMVQAELPKIIDRVNACYGYAAINKIRITQTAATGFAEEQTPFAAAKMQEKPKATAKQIGEISQTVAPLRDDTLKQALETLGQNIISRNNT